MFTFLSAQFSSGNLDNRTTIDDKLPTRSRYVTARNMEWRQIEKLIEIDVVRVCACSAAVIRKINWGKTNKNNNNHLKSMCRCARSDVLRLRFRVNCVEWACN